SPPLPVFIRLFLHAALPISELGRSAGVRSLAFTRASVRGAARGHRPAATPVRRNGLRRPVTSWMDRFVRLCPTSGGCVDTLLPQSVSRGQQPSPSPTSLPPQLPPRYLRPP